MLGLFFYFPLCGQAISVEGQVTDTAGNALPYANIMAKNLSEKADPVFGISNEDGRFKLRLKNGRKFEIHIYYLGYKPAREIVDSSRNTWKFQIRLQPSVDVLEAATIEIRMPVRVKGDSIIYTVDSFRNGTEWKLKDLIRKMPGMEITPEGQIKVMGKDVSKVLVENKKFFGGNSKLALDNIPADAVDGIEAIDDYNSIDFMRGLDDKSQLILNIKLKKNKKRFGFGQIEGGAGYLRKYNIGTQLFYFSPENHITVLANAGNTAYSLLNFGDLVKMQDFDSRSRQQNALQTLQIANSFFSKNFYRKNQISGAMQWHRDGKNWNLSAFAIGLTGSKHQQKHENITRIRTEFSENINQNTCQNYSPVLINLYFRKKQSVWDYTDFVFLLTTTQNNREIETEGQWDTDSYENLSAGKNVVIDSRFSFTRYKKLSRRHIIKFIVKAGSNRQNISNEYTYDRLGTIFLPVVPDTIYQLQSETRLFENYYSLSAKWYFLMRTNFHIYLGAGMENRFARLYTGDGQMIDEHLTPFDPNIFNNRFKTNYSRFYGLYRFNFKHQNHRLKAGFDVVMWNKSSKSISYVLPYVQHSIQLKRSRKIQVSVNSHLIIPGILQWAPKIRLEDFKWFKRGNPELSPAVKYGFNARYSDFSFDRTYEFYAFTGANITFSPIMDRLFYDGPYVYMFATRSNTPVKSVHETIRFGYYFKKWKIRLNQRLFYHTGEVPTARTGQKYHTYNHSYRLQIQNLSDRKWDWSIAYAWQFADRKTSHTFNRFIRQKFTALLIYRINKNFQTVIKYSVGKDWPVNVVFSISEWEASYRPGDKPWYFKFNAYNLSTSSYKEQFYYQNESSYRIQIRQMPFYVLMSAGLRW